MARISPWLLRFFHTVALRRISVSFRALRGANFSRLPEDDASPLIVVLNHASWWDPLVGFVLGRYLFPGRHFYAPMDEEALRRYRIFRGLGMFPVAMNTARGAAQFLRSAASVLDRGQILAVTPQGQFMDVRARPVVFRPGVAALLHRRAAQGQATTVLTLAMEYTFWDQRLPEILVNCGQPLLVAGSTDASGVPSQQSLQAALETAMTQAQDELAGLSLRRDPAAFVSVVEGRRGTAGFYGWIERVRSMLRGDQRKGDHTAAATAAATSQTMARKDTAALRDTVARKR